VRLITDITTNGSYVLVRCKGSYVCEEDIRGIAEKVSEVQLKPTTVLIDLSELQSIRDTDLSMLWLRSMEAKAHGWEIAFVRMPKHLQTFLSSRGMGELVPSYQNEASALGIFETPSRQRMARRAAS
jgi:hypothetical protein